MPPEEVCWRYGRLVPAHMGARADKPKRGCIAAPIYIHVVYLYAPRAFVTHHRLAFVASRPRLEPVPSRENSTMLR